MLKERKLGKWKNEGNIGSWDRIKEEGGMNFSLSTEDVPADYLVYEMSHGVICTT